jgi:hypothetical protein
MYAILSQRGDARCEALHICMGTGPHIITASPIKGAGVSKVIRRDRSDIFRNWFGIAAAALYFACGALANAADEDNSGPISVTDVRGDVTLTQRGKSQKPRVGTKVTPPASVFTGVDSSVELRQGHTTVAVSANTTLDIPSSGLADSRIERIVQSRGSAFYRVGKRASQKLRVETPYLVAVVKGTQFNVVVQPDNTTIALFEGELEIRSTDGNDVVQLNAGEIAIRHGTDTTIRVLRMDTGEALRGQLELQGPALAGGIDGGGTAGAVAPGFIAGGPQAITIGGALPSRGGDVGVAPVAAVAPGGAAIAGTVAATGGLGGGGGGGGTSVGVGVGVGVVVGGEVGLGATANLGQGGMNLSVAAATQTLDAGLTLNSSATGLGVGATANLGAAGAVVTAGADIGIGNGGLGATAGVTADVAGLGATVNIGATANLGAGSVAVTTGASASLGGLNANLGLGTAADLGAGSVAVNTSTSVAGVTAGASITAGSGGIAANANVAGIAISLPTVGLPVITAPVVTAPAVTTTVVTPVITTPVVSVPAVTTPTITTPVITVPAVTVPAITVPAITVPVITVPVITVPPVTAPGGGLGGLLGRLGGRH